MARPLAVTKFSRLISKHLFRTSPHFEQVYQDFDVDSVGSDDYNVTTNNSSRFYFINIGATDSFASYMSRFLSTAQQLEKEAYYRPDIDAKNIDLSFLCDEVSHPLNPRAVKRGNPEGETEVWLVNHKWSDSEKPVQDPLGITESKAYQKHLQQIIFATSNIKWEESLHKPVYEDLDPVDVPYKPTLHNQECIDFETLADVFRQCENVRTGFLEGWQNGAGRVAMETLLKKANSVSEANIYRKLEHMRLHKPARVRNIGGGHYTEGCLRIAYAKLNTNLFVHSKDSLIEKQKKCENIKEMDTWFKHRPFIRKRYTPDVQSSAGSTITYFTGEVKSESSNLQKWMKQTWNQALIGLTHTKKTAALLMRPHEAYILRIEVQGDTINTYKTHYPLLSSASIDPKKIEHFFRDLVLMTFDIHHSDIEYLKM